MRVGTQQEKVVTLRELQQALDALCVDILPEAFIVPEFSVAYARMSTGKPTVFRLSSGMSSSNWKLVSHLTMSLRTKKRKSQEDIEVLKARMRQTRFFAKLV